jgi:NAD(P)-dependent dehydrogenase (short-subunit alcohol dehydrogenase family)
MELFDLQGKSAVVTGSTRGIDRAIATRLAEHGAGVVYTTGQVLVVDGGLMLAGTGALRDALVDFI